MAGPTIVQLNVSLQVAPTPSTLQQTGALLSVGGTVNSPGVLSFLTELSDLTPLLRGAAAISGIAWSGGTATVTTVAPHGITVGQTIQGSIAGVTPAGYNGTFQITSTGASTFTYALASNPGSVTVQGSWTPADVAELLAMATTFFTQGSATGVYVLELGDVDTNSAIAYLASWLTANPGMLYGVYVPRGWDGNSNLLNLIATYEATTAKFYFWIITTLQNYPLYTSLMKSVVALIESPQLTANQQATVSAATWSGGLVTFTTSAAHGVAVGSWFQTAGFSPAGYNGWFQAQPGTTGSTLIGALASNPGSSTVQGTVLATQVANAAVPSTEHSLAGAFRTTLNYRPSNTNKVPPFGYSYVFGVTPFPERGMGPTQTSIKAAATNIIRVNSEGGISNTSIYWGMTKDSNPFNFWYSVDWVQINAQLNLANEVINGSNNPINPLYLNQDGINRLQQRLVRMMRSATTFGLALGTVTQTQMDGPAWATAWENGQFAGQSVVNAVPFTPYYDANVGDYKIGRYAGLSILYVPLRGFDQILVNIVASQFPTFA